VADTPAGPEDHERLVRPQAEQIEAAQCGQGIPGHRAGLLGRQPVGHTRHELRLNDAVLGVEAATRHRHRRSVDTLAHVEPGDVASERGDRARRVPAEDIGEGRRDAESAVVVPLSLDRVPGPDPCELHPDEDVVVADLRERYPAR
jgi:hypothetical protein